jgi:hypothetical protein
MSEIRQIEMDFKPGLTRQYRNVLDCLRTTVYRSRGGLDAVAAALDRSPSEVSKMLNKQDDVENRRRFPLDEFETVIQQTGDLDPIFYLVEKFCVDSEVKRKQAVAQIPGLIARLEELMREAEGK